MIKRFVTTLFGTALVLSVLCAAVTIALDPFYHYHKPWFGLTPVLADKEYQVIGTLEHFDYNALVVGSSVIENYNNAWFDEAFGTKTIKCVRSYGGIADLTWLVRKAYETHNPEQIYFNIDPSALIAKPETTFVATGFPMYLYDENPFNDLHYVLNRDVLFKKIPYMLAQSASGYDAGLSYNWAEGKDFSKEGTLQQYARYKEVQPMQPLEETEVDLQANIALLTEVVEAHPDTEFRFFLPPYSMVWWDDSYRNGLLDTYLHAEQETVRALLSYPNVQFYDFQNETEVITNLNVYMDPVHFSPAINEQIVTWLSQDHDELTLSNMEAAFETSRTFAKDIQQTYMKELEDENAFRYAD